MAGGDLLTMLRTELAELLAAEQVPHGAACKITEQLLARLQQQCGGDRLLVPKIDRAKRNAEIFADWKRGDAIEAIAGRHGVDRATVYRIIERRRTPRQTGGQGGGGFGSDDWNL